MISLHTLQPNQDSKIICAKILPEIWRRKSCYYLQASYIQDYSTWCLLLCRSPWDTTEKNMIAHQKYFMVQYDRCFCKIWNDWRPLPVPTFLFHSNIPRTLLISLIPPCFKYLSSLFPLEFYTAWWIFIGHSVYSLVPQGQSVCVRCPLGLNAPMASWAPMD